MKIAFLKPNFVSNSRRAFHLSQGRLARVLATDDVDEVCINIFKQRGHHVDVSKTLPKEKLFEIIGKYDGLVVRSATKVTADLLKYAPNLKVVGRAGVGIDNIDVGEATKSGVLVMNTPDGNTVSTAQLALSLLCSLARQLPAANMSVKAGLWDRKSFTGIEIAGKTIGVIGCGRIGQVVASGAKTMGMTVLGFDPVMTKEGFSEAGIEQATLDQIWAKCDFITVHTPLTKDTKNLINEVTLSKCKRGVRIINCARGGIVDEIALLAALQDGRVAGAALDVFTSEPPQQHLTQLLQHSNLICTPHLGASTDEAQVNVARDIAVQMCDLFDNKAYVGVLNVPYIASASDPNMLPFMRLAETLGAIQAQLSTSKLTQITIKTFGGRDADITTKPSRQLIEAMVLKGVVAHSGLRAGDKLPDLVSSPAMAHLMGIESVLSTTAPALAGRTSPYLNLVSVEARRADGSVSTITGAVCGTTPHLVQMDEFVELFAIGADCRNLLAFRNQDRPGAISEVLGVLHRDNVNVANMNVARVQAQSSSPSSAAAATASGGAVAGAAVESLALCFMSVDQVISAKGLKELIALPALSRVASIQL